MDYEVIAKRVMVEVGVPPIMRGQTYLRCEHPRHQPRRRKLTNGTTAFYSQCLDCGRAVGGALKKTFAVLDSPPWDEALERKHDELRKRFSDAYTSAIEAERASQSQEFWDLYHRHVRMDNPKWVELRRRVIARCGNVCEGCGNYRVAHVHHTTYDHLGDELLFELRGVCVGCHRKLHPDRF